jgi:biofilm PGA synthesis protein PgaA
VLNDRYLTVLQMLGLVAQQQALTDLPMMPGRRADWEYAQQRAAELQIWGAIDSDQLKGRARYSATEQALELNAAWQSASGLSVDMRRQTLDLRLQLLAQRDQAAAVAFYRSHPDVAWSAPSCAALAGALLAQHNPREAEHWYREALRLQPQADDVLGWQQGLAYALMESGQYRAARTQMDALLAATPRMEADARFGGVAFNADFQSVAVQRAMFAAWMADTSSGQEQLESLLENSPYASDLRQGMAGVALLRGWPRQAGAMYRRLQVDQAPDQDVNTSLGLVDVALETQSFRLADSLLGQLEQDYPGVPSVGDRRQRWRVLTGPEFTMSAGHDLGGVQGANEQNAWDSLTRLYSAPIGAWRVFAQHQLQTGDFTSVDPVQQGRYETLGVGAQYRASWAHGEFGVLNEIEGRGRQGGFAGLDWTPDDRWILGGRYEQNSAALPLAARLADIGGNLGQLSAVYRHSDDVSLSLTVSQLNMSDGNRRQSITAGWDQRLFAGPVYQLELNSLIEASRNDDIDAAQYFNPSQDLGVSVTAMNDWVLWHSYDNSLHQRLGITSGRYHQQGFGSGRLWALTLEQQLDLSQRFSLTYGFTRSAHPYDGSTNFGNRVYLNVDWHF